MQKQEIQIVKALVNDATLQTLLSGVVADPKVYVQIPDMMEKFPCIVYAIVNSSHRSIPINSQDITVQFDIYSKVSKQQIEDIYSRLNTLLNYYKNWTQDIVYMRQDMELDDFETDRTLFRKTLRYQIWGLN